VDSHFKYQEIIDLATESNSSLFSRHDIKDVEKISKDQSQKILRFFQERNHLNFPDWMLLRIKNKTLVALLSTLLKITNCQILNNFMREIQTKNLKELIYQSYDDYKKIYGKCYVKQAFGNSNINII
jgi:hypothetical protein